VEFVENKALSGILREAADEQTHRPLQPADNHAVVRRRAVSLVTVLAEGRTPRVIDYLSLDIEGAELHVMEDFAFDKYTFLAITVECPRALRQLLEANGYVYVRDTECEFGDELYLHKSFPGLGALLHEMHRPKPRALTEWGYEVLAQKQVPHPPDVSIFISKYSFYYYARGDEGQGLGGGGGGGGGGGSPGLGARLRIRIHGVQRDAMYMCVVFLARAGDSERVLFKDQVLVMLPEEGGTGPNRDEVEVDYYVGRAAEDGKCDLEVMLYDDHRRIPIEERLVAKRLWAGVTSLGAREAQVTRLS
jgi:hypothetical protein